jgi:putative peptidoglycan lipid II flippase
MTIGTVLSRATGLLRLAALAAALGVTRVADIYNLANTAPNIIYELVLGGVLTSVFVPVFVELLEKEGREKAWQVVSAIINVSLLILLAICALGILAAPLIARVYTARIEGPDIDTQRQILVLLLRLFIPQIVFYGLTAMTAGVLNAHKRFGAPMYTPVLNNLAVIATLVFFYFAYRDVDLDTITTGQVLVLGLGTSAGVALMALAQIPFLRGLGTYRWTLSIAHPSVRKLLRLSVFVIGYVVANQIGYLFVQWLAYRDAGAYSAYSYAFIFFMLPHGLVAVSIITALLPGMSEHATNERWDAFRERLSVGVRSTFLLVIPAAIGYLVLSEPIVALLENGVMNDSSVELVASVLRIFVVGLVPFSIFQLFLRAFYSLHDTRTPFLINCAAVALNMVVNVPLFVAFGVRGLAAGHALSYVFGVIAQARHLSRRLGGLDGRRIAASGSRIAAAGLGMGVLVWVVSGIAGGLVDPTGFTARVAVTTSLVALGCGTYFAFAYLFKVPELELVLTTISRRLSRSGG